MLHVQLMYDSIHLWHDPSTWAQYFLRVQELLGAPLTHLDVNDPIRRRVTTLDDAGRLVCAFERNENARWLFGEFRDVGVELSIQHYRKIEKWHNMLNWYVPVDYSCAAGRWESLRGLFALGSEILRPFYACADWQKIFASLAVRKQTFGALNVEAELLGVFWLTYFCPAYVEFFGRGRFGAVPGSRLAADGSMLVTLGADPDSVTPEDRENAAARLGRKSFVDLSDLVPKRAGEHALTFQQLACFVRQ